MNTRTAALMLFLAGCPHSSPEGGPTSGARAEADVWRIDGKDVSRGAFESALNALPGPVERWSCAETTTGGITSWEQSD
jgi:hypothetical protein